MHTLLLAPQPFFQERGTPIAVDRLLRVLSERGDHIHLVTWHEGRDVCYERVTIYRTPNLPFIHNLRPGFSWGKIICDILMFFLVLRLAMRYRYDLVHAVEESVFMAMVLKYVFKLPYVYDMDSSLAQQMIERYPRLVLFSSLLYFFEGIAVKNARAVVPVCDALATVIERHEPEKVVVLQDISLLNDDIVLSNPEDLRITRQIHGQLLMYVGNLETYQGIDLLLSGFAQALRTTDQPMTLVIIGGAAADIAKYQQQCQHMHILDHVYFLGPRPLDHLAMYLAQADILVSPRIKGNNTPMKIYSYLHSGKPLLATDLPTHTQILTNDVAMLSRPEPAAFAAALVRLVEDADLRDRLGFAGKHLIEESYTYSAFHKRVNGLFDWIKGEASEAHSAESTAHSV